MGDMSDVRVLLVGEHKPIRMGIRLIIDGAPGIEVVGEAASTDVALAMARLSRPDVVFLDLEAGSAGARAVDRLGALPEPPRVVVFTSSGARRFLWDVLAAGAVGLVHKDVDPEELVAAVRAVGAGEVVLSPRYAALLVQELTETWRRQPLWAGDDDLRRTLSSREQEVLDLVGLRLSNAEIGGRLHISELTAKTHVARIRAKLGARDRIELIVGARVSA